MIIFQLQKLCSVAYNVTMIMSAERTGLRKEFVVAFIFNFLSWHSPQDTEANHQKPQDVWQHNSILSRCLPNNNLGYYSHTDLFIKN